jgi:hypothetical protein
MDEWNRLRGRINARRRQTHKVCCFYLAFQYNMFYKLQNSAQFFIKPYLMFPVNILFHYKTLGVPENILSEKNKLCNRIFLYHIVSKTWLLETVIRIEIFNR